MHLPTLYDNTDTEDTTQSVLELCHFNLSQFPNLDTYASTLRSLVIIAQDIHEISPFTECKLLEHLWICETKVSDISPLRHCTSLKHLHLYSNSIEDISGLQTLKNLESLWLNDNAIKNISPLFCLHNLCHLNLANNQISEIDPSASNLSSLISLNLAGNLLCSIDTLKNLGGLKRLSAVVFEHAFYGTNPICSLQNYELLFICYCESLTQLNEKSIHQDIVHQANEILYQKTKHFETVWQTKVTQYLKQVAMAHEAISQLSTPLAYLVAFLDWNEVTRPSNSSHPATALYHQHAQQIQTIYQQLNQDLYNQLVLEHSKLKISFFYLNNVSFVDVLPDHLRGWMSKVPDAYMNARFLFITYPFSYPDAPLEMITLNDDLHLLVASKLPCAFCLLNCNASLPTDSPTVPQFVSSDYDAYTSHCFTNWNSLIEHAQTSHLVSIELVHMSLSTLPTTLCLPHVTKVNLSFNAFSELRTVFQVFPQLQSLKIMYNLISHLPSTYPAQFQSIDLSGNRLGLASYFILQAWEQHLVEVIYDDYLIQKPVRLFKDYFLFTEVTNLVLDDVQLQQVDVLAKFCQVHVLSLRNNQLHHVHGLSQLVHLEKLFLGGNALTNIDALGALHQLQVLDCSCNFIKAINLAGSGSRPFPKLMHFNLNGNQLSSLEAFKHFPSLQELYLAYNAIQDPKELNALAHLPLFVLDLTDNLLQFAYYRAYLIYRIPMLQFLDGVTVTDEELAHAKSLLVGCLTREKLLECMHLQRIPMLTSLDLRACQLVKLDCFRAGEFNALAFVNLDHNQFTEVHNLMHLRGLRCLSLNGNKLESLPESNALEPTLWPFLTELFLDQNQISKLTDLHLNNSCELRLLSLRGNRISRLDGLEHYQMVQKLYLDQNQIRHFDPDTASCLRSLKELSLNDNRLKTIRFIRFLPKLKYFFGDRNRVNSLTDLMSHSLQGISLIGNPVARHLHYRVHLIHSISSISRIDGVIVGDEERQHAKNTEAVRWQVTAPLVSTVTKQTLRFSNVTLDGSELEQHQKRHFSSYPHLNYR